MARVLAVALTAFVFLRAGALDSAAEAEAEEFSAGAQAAEVQDLSAHSHRAYLDVTVGAVSAGAQAAEVQELSGHGQRAYLDVTVGAVSAGAQEPRSPKCGRYEWGRLLTAIPVCLD